MLTSVHATVWLKHNTYFVDMIRGLGMIASNAFPYCGLFQEHCIAVSDMGFEPKVLTIHPGDRVWWIWEDTKLQHNIIQVNSYIKGICSI